MCKAHTFLNRYSTYMHDYRVRFLGKSRGFVGQMTLMEGITWSTPSSSWMKKVPILLLILNRLEQVNFNRKRHSTTSQRQCQTMSGCDCGSPNEEWRKKKNIWHGLVVIDSEWLWWRLLSEYNEEQLIKLAEFIENGSGWVVARKSTVALHICLNKTMNKCKGHGEMKLPKSVKNKKAVLNLKGVSEHLWYHVSQSLLG